MSTPSVTVIAKLKAKSGQEASLKQELLGLIPTTRQEEGCINYDLHQSVDDPSMFMFHEKWTSKAALEAHLARPHLVSFMSKADALLAESPKIELYGRIG